MRPWHKIGNWIIDMREIVCVKAISFPPDTSYAILFKSGFEAGISQENGKQFEALLSHWMRFQNGEKE